MPNAPKVPILTTGITTNAPKDPIFTTGITLNTPKGPIFTTTLRPHAGVNLFLLHAPETQVLHAAILGAFHPSGNAVARAITVVT